MSMQNYRELIASVRKRPRIYLVRDDFACLAAFVDGHNGAHEHRLLEGFREWLVTRLGCGDHLFWWSLVAHLSDPVGPKGFHDLDPEDDARIKATLYELLDEFFELREEPDSLARIRAAHQEWRDLRSANSCIAGGATACPRVAWPRGAARIAPETVTAGRGVASAFRQE